MPQFGSRELAILIRNKQKTIAKKEFRRGYDAGNIEISCEIQLRFAASFIITAEIDVGHDVAE
jgi:hypothetical protein